MLRWLLAIVIAVSTTGSARAQVFRPKAGAKKAAEKKPAPAADPESTDKPEKKTAKKQPRTAPTKKRVTSKKKNAAADRARPDDLTPEPEPKAGGKDYVKIWDDDEPE